MRKVKKIALPNKKFIDGFEPLYQTPCESCGYLFLMLQKNEDTDVLCLSCFNKSENQLPKYLDTYSIKELKLWRFYVPEYLLGFDSCFALLPP